MQDTIIKGEGTSRSLKIPASKAVVYQDVSAMVQDMVSGNFLFDLGPIRLEGVTQKGMDLNKANLLTDATAALYGKGSNASPDEILAAIKELIVAANNAANSANTNANSRVKVESGSSTGTISGNYYKFKIHTSFRPKAAVVSNSRNEIIIPSTFGSNYFSFEFGTSTYSNYAFYVAWGN